MNQVKKTKSAQYDLIENVEYSVIGKDGKAKKLFQQNALYTFLMKKNILSPLAYMNMGVLKYILGGYSTKLAIANLVTNAGFAGIASRINGSGGEAAFTYIAVGTGTTAANVADTALQTETAASGLSRANSTVSRATTTVTNDTAQDVTTFTVTGTVAVTESGVLNAASGGTLLCRQVFAAINVVNGDSLQITWKVKAA
jgi:hypothetical protein